MPEGVNHVCVYSDTNLSQSLQRISYNTGCHMVVEVGT